MHVRVLNLGWRWCDGLDRQQEQCENTNNCEKVYCCIFSSSLAQKSIVQRSVLLFSMFCTVALMLNRLLITEVHAHKNIIFSSFLHSNLCLCTRSIHWRWTFVTLKLICKTTAWWINAEPEIPYEPVRMYMISLICQAKSLYDLENSTSDMEWQRDHRSQDLIATEGSIWACGVCLCGCVCVCEREGQ